MDHRMNWGSLSKAERDLSYNNSAAVADSAAQVESWRSASTAFRLAHGGHLDIAYGPKPRNQLDLYPASDASAPCLIFIHGGYWMRNGRENFACMAEGALAKGWSAALPSYTLAPDATLTEIVAEIRRSLDWFAENRALHGITGPVILSGWSAGGHLTAMTFDHPVVKAALPISGVFELGPIRDTYINDAVRLTDEEIVTLSPLRLQSAPKPMSIAYGTRELSALVEDSRALNAMRAMLHQPGHLIPVAGADHFSILESLRKADGLLMRAAEELLHL
ncbi:MAG: alpha/beta hydrolase [Beijerinckiaceae bacterium]|nr:alpha/beta hydrolase [Beijerinckiaceae bacterium]